MVFIVLPTKIVPGLSWFLLLAIRTNLVLLLGDIV